MGQSPVSCTAARRQDNPAMPWHDDLKGAYTFGIAGWMRLTLLSFLSRTRPKLGSMGIPTRGCD
jgi:hypothetical protein